MYFRLFFSFLFLALFSCQSTPKEEDPAVTFLKKKPLVDGRLDAGLESLPSHPFPHIWQFDNPVTDTVKVSYRLGYTPDHLYLYVETEADSIHYRSRGSTNGDGFKLLLALPKAGERSSEYYEIYFDPDRDDEATHERGFVVYNNQQHIRSFSGNTQFEETAYDGKAGFEALIAWEDIPPYHPWMRDEMGYNLYFAKGIGDTITNGYAVVEDEGIWDEVYQRRAFTLMTFERPKRVKDHLVRAQLKKSSLPEGEPLEIKLAGIAPKASPAEWRFMLYDTAGAILHAKDIMMEVQETYEERTVSLSLGGLAPGQYPAYLLNDRDTLIQKVVSILPKPDLAGIRSKLSEPSADIPPVSVHTLQFKANELARRLEELPEYESGENLINYWANFRREYEIFQSGEDPYASVVRPHRRAFRSAYDDSLQPYTLKLPEGYDPSRQYPLLVFLHGSGSDERGVLNQARSGGDFIELAPYGRDKYFCYSSDSSQVDILGAIQDVATHFSVDTNRMVVGGFSMGGYGALRTFYEYPELFRGVAVFAGHPRLASEWLDGEHPDFLQATYLENFNNLPVFVYHGRRDGALPVAKAEALVQTLEAVGARVESSIVSDKRHEYPDAATNERYFAWLREIVR